MKAVILAAGYGTRLQRDIDSDRSGHFQHLAGVAKPLLPVGRCALISHWASVLTRTGCVDGIFVVTNALHHEAFQTWAQEFPNVRVLSDGTRANEDRLGALACLQLTIGHFSLDDHLIVIGGDTLFKEDFSLLKFMGRFSELQAECGDSSLVLTYRCKDEETSKYGILEVDHDLRATCMLEKPRPSETQSRKACPCFYLLSRTCLPLLPEFLHEKKAAPIEERDAPGIFLSWLITRKPVYVFEVAGRFDVGNLSSYTECDQYFRSKIHTNENYLK
ncbi:uncharacterized protein LOC114797363 [Denticeps clupeoides]|uniref:Nucleotidyl transferase domain-containing protein n=1 Tax=Denticeps clupeoides TaxID=299321 RepID=A0AAY4EHK0_9TELE|nr:uncharacterized protein LOC114797363 [Denticeps clupeoides]